MLLLLLEHPPADSTVTDTETLPAVEVAGRSWSWAEIDCSRRRVREASERSGTERRKTAWRPHGKEGGVEWRRWASAVIASEGSGERWISVDFSRKGSPKERHTEV